jgi:hypothetical protein
MWNRSIVYQQSGAAYNRSTATEAKFRLGECEVVVFTRYVNQLPVFIDRRVSPTQREAHVR